MVHVNCRAKSCFNSYMLYCSSFHACMCVLMNFELISWQIVTCMFIIKLKSMFSTCFEKNELIRACFEVLKWFEFMHVCMFFMFMKMGLKFGFN